MQHTIPSIVTTNDVSATIQDGIDPGNKKQGLAGLG
jgi:hypothetical protein